jgi:hypothetical protein
MLSLRFLHDPKSGRGIGCGNYEVKVAEGWVSFLNGVKARAELGGVSGLYADPVGRVKSREE